MVSKQNENDNDFALNGKMIIAMPSIGDPRFHKAVILICAHDANGAMGLVINHQLPGLKFPDLISQLGISSNIQVHPQALTLPVMSGGPVEATRGFLLHSNDFRQPGTVQVDAGFCISGTVDALKELVSGNGPDQALFILGYAGWSPGQLERELQDNSWLLVEPDPKIVFHKKLDEKWDMAAAALGIDPARLLGQAGRA